MARILINGVELAINGDAILINGDDEPQGVSPFHKETRQGVLPSWETTRTPTPTRESPQGSTPPSWPRTSPNQL